MMRKILYIISSLMFLANLAHSQTVVATSPVRAHTVLTAAVVGTLDTANIGAFNDPEQVIGFEARVNLYPGRPIHPSDIGPPAILERNQTVILTYKVGLLTITTEGRALERAGIGEQVRVMNMDSRITVAGRVKPDGSVEVGP